jgi:tetratricopeptide (TPR) repeat protein
MSESADRLLAQARRHAAAGMDEDAVRAVSDALALTPEAAAVQHGAATILAGLGRVAEAEDAFRRALALAPGSADPLFGLARLLLSCGRNEQALDLVENGCRLHPRDSRGRHLLGAMYLEQGLLDGAIECLQQAARLGPGNADIRADLGLALQTAGNTDAARARYLDALKIRPEHDVALRGLARLAELAGDPRSALTRLAPVVRDRLASAELLAVYARLLNQCGRRDEATDLLRRRLAEVPASANTLTSAPAQRMPMLFQLGQLLDADGQIDEAMACVLEANRLKQARFDPSRYRTLVDRLLATFSADQMSRLPRSGLGDPRPLLIIGMPRSGTSLAEQILASHPAVVAGGERADLGLLALATADAGLEYPESAARLDRQRLEQMGRHYLDGLGPAKPGVVRFTDKMWQNFEFLGLAELMLPGARIIHCVREPLDCGLSCFFHHFFGSGVAFSYDLAHIGAYISQYQRVMAHWRQVLSLPMFDLNYESLVAEPERNIRQLLDFAGLPWDPACLTFHENRREVRTASFEQVRQPVYQSSVGRHRPYRRWLEPMVQAMEQG